MKVLLSVILICHASPALAQGSEPSLALDRAIQIAVERDPWSSGSRHRQDALNSEAISAGALPDPRVSLMADNLPTDSFHLDQEAMTMLSVGVSQVLPRGQTRDLSSRQKRELAAQEPLLRQDRTARVTATVTGLWLEAFRAQESIRLTEQDRVLFEHLVAATRASYSSALGRARQQDVIRAQLELTQLDDRLTVLRQQLQTAREQLAEWIGDEARLSLPADLPAPDAVASIPALAAGSGSGRQLHERISRHPALLAIGQRIEAMQTGVELAHQKYKPEWSLSARYGYRDADPMGGERADLFSVGVSFDLPIFTEKRQDRDLSAAISKAEALKTEKALMARRLAAELETAIVEWRRLEQRRELYEQQLLPQMADQAEAALTAYNNDLGDFAEAVRARIAELDAKTEALVISVRQRQALATIHYLLTGADRAAGSPE